LACLRCFSCKHELADGQDTMAPGMTFCTKVFQFYTLRAVPFRIFDGRRDLVAPRGETQWARNLRPSAPANCGWAGCRPPDAGRLASGQQLIQVSLVTMPEMMIRALLP
jgi:hypothetical protein